MFGRERTLSGSPEAMKDDCCEVELANRQGTSPIGQCDRAWHSAQPEGTPTTGCDKNIHIDPISARFRHVKHTACSPQCTLEEMSTLRLCDVNFCRSYDFHATSRVVALSLLKPQ